MSELVNGASERSERNEAERCEASERGGPCIALDGSLGIWVKIFISAIWLKLSRMVIVVFVHILPVNMTGFMAI